MVSTGGIACKEPRAESRQTPDKGLGLFATSQILPRDNIFAIIANFATVLDTARLHDTCSNCFVTVGDELNPDLSLKACAGCHVVKYCGKKCQIESWAASHKKECKIYKQCQPRILPMNARAILRIISQPDNKVSKEIYDTHHAVFRTLGHHFSKMDERGGEQAHRITVSAEALKAISNTEVELSTLVVYFAKLETNAFTLTNQYFDRIGLCLLPFAAYINHSCEPNAYIGFDGQVMYLKALQDIAPDEEIFISYTDNTEPLKTRQTELQLRYFFECKCPKCLKGTSAREDQFLTPGGPSCPSQEREARELLAKSKTQGETVRTSVQRIEEAFGLLHATKCWPITRQPLPQLLDEFIVNLLEANCYKSAFLAAVIRYLHIDPVLYPSQLHPIRKRNTWALAKLLRCINQSQDHDASPPTPHLDQLQPDFAWIWYALLHELVETYDDTQGLQLLLNAEYQSICDDMMHHGIDFNTADGRRKNKMAITSALQNLRRVADEELPRLNNNGWKVIGTYLSDAE
ncbi:MYND finger family protein [Histoplasma capsulatum G186AR]|uniref:MYND finger family protein n=2 Tax=Ajellomyces capsulatus TaxID=5037 RepID=C0NFV5_AJECG|nr:MYND finger family protein [Histoplasma capsulatum G186AR]EEH10126.1 MYND finger family protein [Histoplasma capsulatum G186AR]KAG5290921.1 MYND finger family protein [Histoplasma capsulatum]QSS72848.1 MYND finger family protein [Histoplasma capsulatum G186AR]